MGNDSPRDSNLPAGGPPPDLDRTTVLVVDDDAALRLLVGEALSPTYRVLEAEDGQAGLSSVRNHLPDVIVADVMMPRMDGFEMVRRVRDEAATAGIPILLLTARVDTDDELAGLLAGADDYLRKPFEPKVLWARVGNLMARQHRLRERLLQKEEPEEPSRATRGGHTEAGDSSAPASGQGASSAFERMVRRIISNHLGDSDFSVEELAGEMALSRAHLSRKLKRETGYSPTALLRRMRLERGAELLNERFGNVSEVAYAVGFKSLSYFSRCFRERFGVPPSEYSGAQP